MRHNVVILRGRSIGGLSCLRYDINEHSELGRGMFHGRRSHGGVIGSWLCISGSMVYIRDMYWCQCLRKCMAAVLLALTRLFSAYGHDIVLEETRRSILPCIIDDLQGFQPVQEDSSHDLNTKL